MSQNKETKPGVAFPRAILWGASVDLPDSEQERKQYFVTIEDGDKPPLRVIILRGPGPMITIEPYLEHEYDYTEFLFTDEEDEEEQWRWEHGDYDPPDEFYIEEEEEKEEENDVTL